MMDAIADKMTRFYYDDQRVLLETDVTGTETDTRYYVFGNYIDEVLVLHDISAADDYYFAHDHLYSVVCLFDAAGAPAERYEYDAYGKARIFTKGTDGQWFTADDAETIASSYDNPYLFTGRCLDSLDAGSCTLMYYRARTCDPQTGRFMQRDSLGVNPNGGEHNPFDINAQYTEGMNLYEYVQSNSLLFMDAFGLMACNSKETECVPEKPKLPCYWIQIGWAWQKEGSVGYYTEIVPKIPNPYPHPPGCGSGGVFPMRFRYPLNSDTWKNRKPEGCECEFTKIIRLQKVCCGQPRNTFRFVRCGLIQYTRGELYYLRENYRRKTEYGCRCIRDPDGLLIGGPIIGPASF